MGTTSEHFTDECGMWLECFRAVVASGTGSRAYSGVMRVSKGLFMQLVEWILFHLHLTIGYGNIVPELVGSDQYSTNYT